jgi:hypothetical protein
LRVGSGAGFSKDWPDAALALGECGELDYLVLKCLAERTIALESECPTVRGRARSTRGALNA